MQEKETVREGGEGKSSLWRTWVRYRVYLVYVLIGPINFVPMLVNHHYDSQIAEMTRNTDAHMAELSHCVGQMDALSVVTEEVDQEVNDALKTKDVAVAQKRVGEHRARFNLLLSEERAGLLQFSGERESAAMLGGLGTAAVQMTALLDEERRVVESVEKNQVLAALESAQAMARVQYDLHSTLRDVRKGIREIRDAQLQKSMRGIEGVQRRQTRWGAGIAILTFGILIFGLSLAWRAERERGKINQYIKAMRESEERLSQAQRIARIGNWDWDAATNALFWADEIYRIFGMQPRQFGATYEAFLEVVHPDDREFVNQSMREALEGRKPYDLEHRIIKPDGSVGFVHEQAEVFRNAQGKVIRMVGAAQDITERKQAEEKIGKADAQIKLILESVKDAFFAVDNEYRFVYVNETAAKLLRQKREEMLGRTIWAVFPEFVGAPFETNTRRAMEEHSHVHFEEFFSPLGLWLEVSEYRSADGISVFFRDVGERKRIEEELKSTMKMQADFVSFVSHQLRTPLAGIRWMLELADGEPNVPEDASNHIHDAQQSTVRLVTLVNDLLNISRLERGKIEIIPGPTHLGRLTESVLKDIAVLVTEKKHTLTVEGIEDVPVQMLDPQLMRQVVLNLLSNAIKYTEPGGKIAVRLERRNGDVHWSVQDNGLGIPEKSQARMFEKFYRADNITKVVTEGTGLGLYIVRLILERMGGKIGFESEEGKGTRFYFTIPVSEEAVRGAGKEEDLAGGRPGTVAQGVRDGLAAQRV